MPQFDEDVLQCFEDNPSTNTLCLLVKLVLMVILCGTMYVSSRSNLSISRRCRLWALKVTFIETNLSISLCTVAHRSLTFLQLFCFQMRPASPGRRFSAATTAMFGQKKSLMRHLFTATRNALLSTFGQELYLTV